MFKKILKTILAIIPIINTWFIWRGSKIIPIVGTAFWPLRIFVFIISIIVFPIGIIIALWWVWVLA